MWQSGGEHKVIVGTMITAVRWRDGRVDGWDRTQQKIFLVDVPGLQKVPQRSCLTASYWMGPTRNPKKAIVGPPPATLSFSLIATVIVLIYDSATLPLVLGPGQTKALWAWVLATCSTTLDLPGKSCNLYNLIN